MIRKLTTFKDCLYIYVRNRVRKHLMQKNRPCQTLDQCHLVELPEVMILLEAVEEAGWEYRLLQWFLQPPLDGNQMNPNKDFSSCQQVPVTTKNKKDDKFRLSKQQTSNAFIKNDEANSQCLRIFSNYIRIIINSLCEQI